ncbi:MAG: Rrf2 family transcriptional regulator [Melioribacteraceae bacterium]|nr:Rrf2 family transcriptional regulator [Melioribacteraceae bacterium]
MLKIAKSVEYAILAVKYIHENSHKGSISTKEISNVLNIPFDLLAKILQKLMKEQIIQSKQGTRGGYSMKSKLSEVSITKLIEALDQKIQLTDCMVQNPSASDCGRFDTCCLRGPLGQIQDKINLLFSNTTMEEIIQSN